MLSLPQILPLPVPGVTLARLRNWLGGGLCLILGAQLCPLRAGVVQGHSMEPTLAPGSLFVYDQTYYRRHPVRSGDVLLIRESGGIWVKRVYAVEGESFWTLRDRMPDGQFRRDPIARGQEGRFSQVAALWQRRHRRDVKVVRLRLPSGRLFLVGDGAWSKDSRILGPLALAAVVGRVIELPGQRLSVVPDSVALSFPKMATRTGGPATDPLTSPAARATHRPLPLRHGLLRSTGIRPASLDSAKRARISEAAGVRSRWKPAGGSRPPPS